MKIEETYKYGGMKDNPKVMRDFVSAIILQAIADYYKKPHRRDEVRQFFKSEWGWHLCSALELDAADILNKLERGKISPEGL